MGQSAGGEQERFRDTGCGFVVQMVDKAAQTGFRDGQDGFAQGHAVIPQRDSSSVSSTNKSMGNLLHNGDWTLQIL